MHTQNSAIPEVVYAEFLRRYAEPRKVSRTTYPAIATHPLNDLPVEQWPDRIQIGETIGQGSSGGVYSGRDQETGSLFAIKLPHDLTPYADRAIQHEYNALRLLEHPAIVKPLGLCRFQGQFALVMEALQRRPFLSSIRKDTPVGQLPDLYTLCETLIPLIDALEMMHARGWIHGDLKPAHVLWNSEDRPQWCDLEAARRIDRQPWHLESRRTSGTFAYLAPETIADATVGPAADIFSFGRILSACLAGRLPNWDPQAGQEKSDAAIANQLPLETPIILRDLCVTMLRLDPEARPSASECSMVLQTLLVHQSPQHSPPVTADPQYVTAPGAASALRSRLRSLASLPLNPNYNKIVLTPSHILSPEELERALINSPGDEPRLVLSGRADSHSAVPMTSLSEICTQLADWLSALPPTFRERWKPENPDALAAVSTALARVFDDAAPRIAAPTATQLEAASTVLAELLRNIAEQRRCILVIHDFERLDPASALCLHHLFDTPQVEELILIATCHSQHTLARNPSAHALINTPHTPSPHREHRA